MLMRFFFFNDVHLMTRNSKTTIQKHHKEDKKPVSSSFPFTQNSAIFQLMLFLVFKIKKKRKENNNKKRTETSSTSFLKISYKTL